MVMLSESSVIVAMFASVSLSLLTPPPSSSSLSSLSRPGDLRLPRVARRRALSFADVATSKTWADVASTWGFRARAFQKRHLRFEIVPRDDRSSKNQPKRGENDRARSL